MDFNNEEISFTKLVKEEVALNKEYTPNQYKALLSGFIKINSHLIMRNGKWILSIKSENIKTAELIIKQLKLIYNAEASIAITEKKRLRTKTNNKIVIIEIYNNVEDILKDLQIYSSEHAFNELPNIKLLSDHEILRAYLAGCFLASGSVNSPLTKNYHLEISVVMEKYADFLIKQMKKFYLDAKKILRRNLYVVYLKKSEQIADFLRVINAHNALLNFEDSRIQRDQYNSVNRIINCEVSNEKKAMETGNSQADDIRWYRDNFGLENLDPKLRIIATVRLANPDATYLELVKDCKTQFGVELSKPGLSYRMKKLLEEIYKVKGDL